MKITEAQITNWFTYHAPTPGGFAAVVRSVDEALAAVERCRKGEVG